MQKSVPFPPSILSAPPSPQTYSPANGVVIRDTDMGTTPNSAQSNANRERKRYAIKRDFGGITKRPCSGAECGGGRRGCDAAGRPRSPAPPRGRRPPPP